MVPGDLAPPGMMVGAKPKDFAGTIRKLVGYLGRHLPWMILVGVLAVLSTVFAIVGPRILGNATDELMAGLKRMFSGTGGIDFDAIGRIMLWLIGLYGVSALLSYLQGHIMAGVTTKVTYQLRKDIEDKIHGLPFSFYDTTTNGEILSLVTNDVDIIGHNLNQSITQIITSFVTVVGILVMMFSISWQLTLVALCIVPTTMLVAGLVMAKSQKHFRNQQEYLGHVNGHIEEIYDSHVVVKAFNGEQEATRQFADLNETLYQSAWKAHFLSGLIHPILNVIGNFGYVAICVLGGYLAVNGTITIGGIQSFVQYVRQFNQPIFQLTNISNILQQTAAAAERIFAFLEQPNEAPDPDHALSLDRQSVSGQVTFKDVSFGYKPGQPVIHRFSADIQAGQKVAIVGPTGAGKTTMVKLLMRFYDVDQGSILIDGHDIRDIRRDDLRSIMGMVLQDTWLFNGTIADNIRYGKLDATEEQVRQAAEAAQVDHFVRTLPDGYQMELNEEASNVSQGQKQLLTIARAILADPKILILDEATSSVDTRTEMLIQKAMDTLMQGRTCFIIAHRLSTIRNADLILVMNNGDIVEQGTHDQLMAKGGFYAALYNSQFEQVG